MKKFVSEEIRNPVREHQKKSQNSSTQMVLHGMNMHNNK